MTHAAYFLQTDPSNTWVSSSSIPTCLYGIIFDWTRLVVDSVVQPCFIKLVFDNGTSQEFYLVKDIVLLPDTSLVSSSAALGEAILRLTVGEKFSLAIGDKKLTGEIVEIS